MGGIVKIGPWGGEGGRDFDIPATAQPQRLEAITICSSLAVVDAISFTYRDENDEPHFSGVWGGRGGDPQVVRLEAEEFVTEISGTVGYIGVQPSDVVTSLTIVTNRRRHGPFGDAVEPDGTPFSVPVLNGGSIVALFGRERDYIDAIGVYVRV
ncbi:hypothetical protein ACP70R_014317 [Stipagrostis hirtigluma subsp. patula]